MALREKLGIEGEPEFHPAYRMQVLAAFWQHWALHKRTCDKTGKPIISVFSAACPYPVWHRDEWMKYADPPHRDFDGSRPVFEQMWELFQQCPIPHNVGTGNENCEYTDDWWYSKNCYLCHCGYEDEDLRSCYRVIKTKNCQFCVFTFGCERGIDLVDCYQCFELIHSYKCWQCSDSAFLYDCRNCHHCLFSSNLRNASYCYENEQLSKEAYEEKVREWDFRSRKKYEVARVRFFAMLHTRAWHRSVFLDKCEASTGNYLHESKDSENCYFLTEGLENAVNCLRGGNNNRDALDTVGLMESQLLFNSCLPQDNCYEVKNCHNVVQCKWVEYCTHSFQCEHCFGCCGLKGKKYHIFNKPYSPEEYATLRSEIIDAMRSTGDWNRFFPNHFAAQPYQESLASFYWPLSRADCDRLGFRQSPPEPARTMEALDAAQVPDHSNEADKNLTKHVFWDSVASRPFQIAQPDIDFAKELGAPLPNSFYMRRLQDNFRLIPFNGTLRETTCGLCKKMTKTGWPQEYDGRILCEECYLKEVY